MFVEPLPHRHPRSARQRQAGDLASCPHGEQVEKFGDPMGAFAGALPPPMSIAAALVLGRRRRNIAEGPFGTNPAASEVPSSSNWNGRRPSTFLSVPAVKRIIVESPPRQIEVASRVHTRFGASIVRMDDVSSWATMERERHVQLNEEELIGRYFGERIGLMVDVGANFGTGDARSAWAKSAGWSMRSSPMAQNRMNGSITFRWTPMRLVVNDPAVRRRTARRRDARRPGRWSGSPAFGRFPRASCERGHPTIDAITWPSGISSMSTS